MLSLHAARCLITNDFMAAFAYRLDCLKIQL